MRTEREMLDLAAKAAGYWSEEFECASDLPRAGWNPRDDDGDALRLAVRLSMCVTQWINTSYPPHVMVGYRTGPDSGDNLTEDHGNDPTAATRLAILRAAAEIGAAMP